MHATKLRKMGGAIMLAIPPAILDLLNLKAGATVGLTAEQGRLVIEPAPRPRYTLDELLAEFDASAEISPDEQAWLVSKPMGRELL
ncbi:MazE family transcriptional regulator [Geomonas sp. Red276]